MYTAKRLFRPEQRTQAEDLNHPQPPSSTTHILWSEGEPHLWRRRDQAEVHREEGAGAVGRSALRAVAQACHAGGRVPAEAVRPDRAENLLGGALPRARAARPRGAAQNASSSLRLAGSGRGVDAGSSAGRRAGGAPAAGRARARGGGGGGDMGSGAPAGRLCCCSRGGGGAGWHARPPSSSSSTDVDRDRGPAPCAERHIPCAISVH